jgi:hypothetical protein
MKTLRNPSDKEEIIRRLQSITPSSQRRWGRMSAHQMVCHLSDAYRMFLGEKVVPVVPQRLPAALLKFTALWVPLPWPHGFRAAPELDQQIGGTPPAQFDADMNDLLKTIARFTVQPANTQRRPHPHFGPLSDKEWMRLGYLHPDHHLRQFGA